MRGKPRGQPIHRAIVWQCRRTTEICEELKAQGLEPLFRERTGLVMDAYFSGTKVKHLLDTHEGLRARAERGELLFGTVDTYLIWRMTGGRSHVTDATNAARTLLYNITEGRWDEEVCRLFDIPMNMLPEVKDCAADFGMARADLFGREIPILGVAGDQQAATVGQACFEPGMLKSTYGTGCFALLNTGATPVFSKNRLLSTIAYQLDGTPTFALEGSIFIAGAVVQWLRDGIKIIREAPETQPLAEAADPLQNVVLVPAFTGLGAPYWNADCRGAVFGLTRNSGPAELARAALESVGYQTRDLLPADAAAAPPFRLQALSGEFVDLADLRGRPTLVYFFAPWCRICSASASNIQHLRTALPATDLNIVMIALSYETSGEVWAFARRHDLEIPVLLGTTATARDFQVPGFPTYYVIDSNGAIVSRDFGYTTYLGLRWRMFLAE